MPHLPESKFESRPPPPLPFLPALRRLRPQIHQHPQWTMFRPCRRTRSFTGRPDRAHDLRPHSFHGADLACCSAFRSRAKIWKPRTTCARNSGTGKGRSWTDELIGELPGPWTWAGPGISGAQLWYWKAQHEFVFANGSLLRFYQQVWS